MSASSLVSSKSPSEGVTELSMHSQSRVGPLWNKKLQQSNKKRKIDSDTVKVDFNVRDNSLKSSSILDNKHQCSFSTSCLNYENEQAYINQQNPYSSDEEEEDHKPCPNRTGAPHGDNAIIQMQNSGCSEVYAGVVVSRSGTALRKSATVTGGVHIKLTRGERSSGVDLASSDVQSTNSATESGIDTFVRPNPLPQTVPTVSLPRTNRKFKSEVSGHQLATHHLSSLVSSLPMKTVTHPTIVDLTADWYWSVESIESPNGNNVSGAEQLAATVVDPDLESEKQGMTRTVDIADTPSIESVDSSQSSEDYDTTKQLALPPIVDLKSEKDSSSVIDKLSPRPSMKEQTSFVDNLPPCEDYTAYLYTEKEMGENDPLDPDTCFIGIGQLLPVTWEDQPVKVLTALMTPADRGVNMVGSSFIREVLEKEARVMMQEDNILVTGLEFYEESKDVFKMKKGSQSIIRSNATYKELYDSV